MIERQLGYWFSASWDKMTTGRRPRCSEPDRGSRRTHHTSPLFTPRAAKMLLTRSGQLRVEIDLGPGILLSEAT